MSTPNREGDHLGPMGLEVLDLARTLVGDGDDRRLRGEGNEGNQSGKNDPADETRMRSHKISFRWDRGISHYIRAERMSTIGGHGADERGTG